MAAAFSAARLSEAGRPGAGCALAWVMSGQEEEGAFRVEAVIGKVVAVGQTAYANQGRIAAGVVLYRIVWHQGYPPGMLEFDQSLAFGAAADEASAREDAEFIDLEESERMAAA
eukprot:4648986-Pleurochrysis_carterae.AAC.3